MSGGGSVGSADSRFERRGTVNTSSYRDLSGGHADRFMSGINALKPGAANAGVDSMLSRRMQAKESDSPYRPELCNVIRSNMPGVASPGQGALQTQANRDVYSNEYADKTFDRYSNELQSALSGARSGPQATRGGTAAQGFMMSEVANDMGRNREDMLVRNRQADAGIGQQAAGQLQQSRSAMDGSAMQGIGLSQQNLFSLLGNQLSSAGMATDRVQGHNSVVPTFASLATPMIGTESNNLEGKGGQSSSSMGGGFNLCCFIMMEAYNGDMPWYVRACRDKFAPESTRRRNGYIRMSRWLVPAMRTSGSVRKLTGHLLIQPLTRWGAWHMSMRSEVSLMDRVLKNAWFGIWSLIGNKN